MANKSGILKEFVEFLWKEKMWWMIPLVIVFILIGLLLYFAQGSLAPFIYPLF